MIRQADGSYLIDSTVPGWHRAFIGIFLNPFTPEPSSKLVIKNLKNVAEINMSEFGHQFLSVLKRVLMPAFHLEIWPDDIDFIFLGRIINIFENGRADFIQINGSLRKPPTLLLQYDTFSLSSRLSNPNLIMDKIRAIENSFEGYQLKLAVLYYDGEIGTYACQWDGSAIYFTLSSLNKKIIFWSRGDFFNTTALNRVDGQGCEVIVFLNKIYIKDTCGFGASRESLEAMLSRIFYEEQATSAHSGDHSGSTSSRSSNSRSSDSYSNYSDDESEEELLN